MKSQEEKVNTSLKAIVSFLVRSLVQFIDSGEQIHIESVWIPGSMSGVWQCLSANGRRKTRSMSIFA